MPVRVQRVQRRLCRGVRGPAVVAALRRGAPRVGLGRAHLVDGVRRDVHVKADPKPVLLLPLRRQVRRHVLGRGAVVAGEVHDAAQPRVRRQVGRELLGLGDGRPAAVPLQGGYTEGPEARGRVEVGGVAVGDGDGVAGVHERLDGVGADEAVAADDEHVLAAAVPLAVADAVGGG